MYVHPAFKTDENSAWTFVKERGFGAVVAIDDGQAVAAHVPFLVTDHCGEKRIEFHVARANPIHGAIAANPRVTVIVSGADAYISPDWYVAPEQVPTWNYLAAHIVGVAAPMPPERAHAHVEALSLAFETRLAPKRPWRTSKMTEQKLAMMLKAIVPMEMRAGRIEAAFKLSQNKSTTDIQEVARMLHWRSGCGERAIAEAMQKRLKASARSTKEVV